MAAFPRTQRLLRNYAEVWSQGQELRRLHGMSDAQLKRIGISRDEIVDHVFGNVR